MSNIEVHRYANPGEWLGWIEPEDSSWIIFVDNQHAAHCYLSRDPKTGAVLD
jgi:hypothetical protein